MQSKFVVLTLVLFVSFISTCSKVKSPTEPEAPSIELESRSGTLQIPEGATVSEEDLEVTSFVEKADISHDGQFQINATKAEKFQVLLFNEKATNNPVYLGLYNPTFNNVTANDTSTALALTLFNPLLIYSEQSDREMYLEAVKQNDKFNQLLELLGTAYKTNAGTALDYETNPLIYQTVVQLMKETMENLGGNNAFKSLSKEVSVGNPPYIEDKPGDDIAFINPRYVWYAAGIYDSENSLRGIKSVKRKVTILNFNFGWPPVVPSDPEPTEYQLGDGDFRIDFAKGFDFTKIAQWDDPMGRATVLNSGQTILYIVELLIGKLADVDLATLPNHFHVSAERGSQLTLDITQGNMTGFLTHFLSLIADNSEQIAYWIFQEYQTNAAHQFINACTTIFTKVTKVLELVGYVNEQGPFVFDLIFAPKDITYFVTQTDGIIQSTEQNEPPIPEFGISPPAGIIGTVFDCNASATTDDHDDLSDLEFRWDWESDGIWDTNWSSNTTQTHSYPQSDAYVITLEVKDSHGLTGSVSHILNVGGGAGTATHVKLFRDNLPWDSYALENMLESLGFTYGQGDNTYEIISSDQMPSVSLVPGEDLVIIANDQNQGFYNNYARSQVRFTNFVYNGGALFWEACDEGWAEGSMLEAEVVLPGNLVTEFDYDYWNYVTDTNLPLISGLPNSMDHNYASHESFSNLPDGTTIYCVNEDDEPTLIEFNFGNGWIIITGQPLEHQYDRVYGSPDMEEMLPRIVSYFTGKSLSKSMQKRIAPISKRTSH